MKSVEQKIVKVISENLDYGAEKINHDTRIYDDLGLGSLDSVELIIELEDLFDCEVDDVTSLEWATVGDIIDYFNKMTG